MEEQEERGGRGHGVQLSRCCPRGREVKVRLAGESKVGGQQSDVTGWWSRLSQVVASASGRNEVVVVVMLVLVCQAFVAVH